MTDTDHTFVAETMLRRLVKDWNVDAEWHFAKVLGELLSIPHPNGNVALVARAGLLPGEERDRLPERCVRVSTPDGIETVHACRPGSSACVCGKHIYPARARVP